MIGRAILIKYDCEEVSESLKSNESLDNDNNSDEQQFYEHSASLNKKGKPNKIVNPLIKYKETNFVLNDDIIFFEAMRNYSHFFFFI